MAANERLAEIQKAAMAKASGSSVCFMAIKNDGSEDRPIRLGSGSLVERHGSHFIFTAEHITIEAPGRSLYIGGHDGKPIDLDEGKVFSADDPDDISIIRLPSKCARDLRAHKRFIPWSEIDFAHVPSAGGFYLVQGFPTEWSESLDASHKSWHMEALSFGTTVFDGETGLTDGRHIVLQYPRKEIWDGDMKASSLPDPDGISGGGIWKIFEAGAILPSWSVDQVRFLGVINHSLNERGNSPSGSSFIVGTKANRIADLMIHFKV